MTNKSIDLLFESVDVLDPSTWKWYFLDERENKIGEDFGLIPMEGYIRIIGEFHGENKEKFLKLLEATRITIYYSSAPNERKLVKRYLNSERYVFQTFRTLVFPKWTISYKKEEYREVRIFPK